MDPSQGIDSCPSKVQGKKKVVDKKAERLGNFKWTPQLLDILLDTLIEIGAKGGKKSNNGFRWGTIKKCAQRFKDLGLGHDGRCPDAAVIKNKMRSLRTKYYLVRAAANASGFGMDSEGRILADDNAWLEYVVAHPKSKKLRDTPFRYYDRMTLIYGNHMATNDNAYSVGDEDISETGLQSFLHGRSEGLVSQLNMMATKKQILQRGKVDANIIDKLYERNLLHCIFGRLTSEEIYEAAGVSKKWKKFLCKPFIHSLYSLNPFFSHGAFLLECKVYNIAFVVDVQGQCHAIRDYNRLLGVTCNGMIFTASGGRWNEMQITNLLVMRSKVFPYKNLPLCKFNGAYFNPSTCVFTYLQGYFNHDSSSFIADLFDSGSQKWRKIRDTSTLSLRPKGMGVYSHDTLFWMDEDARGVVAFGLSDHKFRLLSVPLSKDKIAFRFKGWYLKGTEDNIILMYNSWPRYAWRLKWEVKDTHEWVPLQIDVAKLTYNCWCSCEWAEGFGGYQVNRDGWWLIVHKCSDDNPHVLIYDNNGQLRHDISRRQLVSCLSSPLPPEGFILEDAWPFEINNICWPRA